jgi:hypothetical protein
MIATVTVAIAVAVTPAAMRNAEHALDRAHGAANTGPDRATYDPANRTRDAIALLGAFLRSAHDALGVADMGNRQ